MLMAGVGRACITPPLDTPNGMFVAQKHIFPDGLHQDLWVTVLILAEGEERIALLDFDFCLLSDEQAVMIRDAVAKSTGMDAAKVLPFLTHNHAGPVTYVSYSGAGEERVRSYFESVPGLAAGAARYASLHMTPVRIAAGNGISEIGVNRDLPLDSGRIVTGPNPDGFRDQEVGVIRMDRLDGSPFVCVVNYACHPTVLGPANKMISPDYPGSTKRTIEQLTGATCLFLQGAAGNMGPIEGFTGDVKIAERLGKLLGLEASKVFLSLNTSPTCKKLHEIIESGAPLTQYIDVPILQESDKLRLITRTVSLPYRNPFSNMLESSEEKLVNCRAELQELLDRGGKEEEEAVIKKRQQMDRLMIHVNRLHTYRKTSHQLVPIHAIRIGPVAILATGNEPYCEIGVEVKRNSPFPHTLFAAYLAGDSVYIPTPDVYLPQPPFEVEYSPFSPDAAHMFVEAANSLLYELKTCEMNEEETKYNLLEE